MGETSVTSTVENSDAGHQALSFNERFYLNEGALLEPLVSLEPIDRLDADTVNGIAAMPKSFVAEFIDEYTVDQEAQSLIVRFRDIRALARLRQANASTEEVDILVPAAKSKSREIPQKTFKELVREKLFADPDTPALDQISPLVAKKPYDWQVLQTICREFQGRHDLNETDNQQMAGTVAEALRTAYNRHLFGKQAARHHLPENYVGAWIAGLAQSKPGFERSMQLEIIETAFGAVKPDANVNQVLIIVMATTLRIKKLRTEMGDSSQLDSMVESLLDVLRVKLRRNSRATAKLKDFIDKVEIVPDGPVIENSPQPLVIPEPNPYTFD